MENTINRSDVIIIGQGPAGLSASVYTSRAGLSTTIIGCEPKIAGDYAIDNYLGFPEGISGKDLLRLGIEQSKKFGTVIVDDNVLSIHPHDEGYLVKTENSEYLGCTVILATGINRKKPGIARLDEYEGRGVSYCVSCDGYFFKEKKVMVLGEGNYAANQALELLEYTPSVSVCTMGKPSTISEKFKSMLDESGIEIVEAKITDIEGMLKVDGVVFEDGSRRDVDGLFVAYGDASSLDFAKSLGIFTRESYIEVDDRQQTNVPGIFAAGDCTGGFLQIGVAVGEGAKAARSAIEYNKNICRESALQKM